MMQLGGDGDRMPWKCAVVSVLRTVAGAGVDFDRSIMVHNYNWDTHRTAVF